MSGRSPDASRALAEEHHAILTRMKGLMADRTTPEQLTIGAVLCVDVVKTLPEITRVHMARTIAGMIMDAFPAPGDENVPRPRKHKHEWAPDGTQCLHCFLTRREAVAIGSEFCTR